MYKINDIFRYKYQPRNLWKLVEIANYGYKWFILEDEHGHNWGCKRLKPLFIKVKRPDKLKRPYAPQ